MDQILENRILELVQVNKRLRELRQTIHAHSNFPDKRLALHNLDHVVINEDYLLVRRIYLINEIDIRFQRIIAVELIWSDVADISQQVLDIIVRATSTPASVIQAAATKEISAINSVGKTIDCLNVAAMDYARTTTTAIKNMISMGLKDHYAVLAGLIHKAYTERRYGFHPITVIE